MTAPQGPGRELLTRRQWLEMRALAADLHVDGWAQFFLVREAVASVALEHPEWDMDETRTYAQWQAS